MAAEHAQRNDTGLYPTLYAVFDKRSEKGQVHGYGEGGRAVKVGYFNSQECTSRGVRCYLASACDIVCDLGNTVLPLYRDRIHQLESSYEEY